MELKKIISQEVFYFYYSGEKYVRRTALQSGEVLWEITEEYYGNQFLWLADKELIDNLENEYQKQRD